MSLSGAGVLSFNQFKLGLSEQVTFVVGPNGAGKSNLARLLAICLRALEGADGNAGGADQRLAPFLAARHVASQASSVSARVAVRLTDMAEQELVTEFIRAVVRRAIVEDGLLVQNLAEIDSWVQAEITEDKLQPLMEGEIVTSHSGTQDGRWRCAYEFTAPGHDQSQHRYQWMLLGSGTIFDADTPTIAKASSIATRIRGSDSLAHGVMPVPGGFQLLDLLPKLDLPTSKCSFPLGGRQSGSLRRFAGMAGLPPRTDGDKSRVVSLATVLWLIFQRALVQTSDTRLLPSGAINRSSSELALGVEGEAQLPDLLLRLKNGDPSERARYQRIRDLFTEFTQGRSCEVRLIQAQKAAQGDQVTTVQVPAVWVTIDAGTGSAAQDQEVPIEVAGAGAWEALVLASALAESSRSVVLLDEPAAALHPSLQRLLGGRLLSAAAQFLVITHSAELVPLADAANVKLVRLDRDDKSATRPWVVDEACRVKMARKLAAKGNERLPFAWRAILCEGQDDVEAIMALAARMGIDLRRHNIPVTDCGGRDNLPDYIWFCAELGIKYLALMDADSTTPSALAKAQAVRDAVSLRHGGEVAEFPISLETTFGVRKQNPSLVPGAIRVLPFDGDMPDPAQAPPEVVALAAAIRCLTK
jgi:predicted ATPase